MSGIKTGNKGFVNPVDGKVYSVDPGVGSVNTVGKVYDPGDMTVDQGIKDISKPTRITLGTYLSNATKGLVGSTIVSNKYTIDSSTDASLAATLVDATGYPMPVSPTTNSSKFAGSLPSSFSDDFSAFQGDAGDNKIKKGLSATPGKDGNELLAETSIVNTTVVSAYQTFAFIPNYRAPGDVFTTVDITSPPRLFDPTLVKQGLLKVLPNAEAIVVGDLVLKLADIVGTPATLTAAAKNAYPVSIPVPANFILTSTTTEGYPSPLTTPGNQNTAVFAPGGAGNVTIQSSVSDNYIKASSTVGVVTTVIGKGKSLETTTKKLLDGNELLPGVKKDALQPALAAYTFAATDLNYRVPGTNFTTEDILSPSSDFDPEKVQYDSLTKVMPNVEAVVAGDLALKLADIVGTPATLTTAANNAYPVSIPVPANFILASTTTKGYPSPLTTPTKQNATVFATNIDDIHASVSNNYKMASSTVGSGDNAVTTVIGKGKSLETTTKKLLDGNELLPGVGKDANNIVTLQPALKAYTDAATSPNYRVPGSVFTTDDITEAPASFDPKLVQYASLTKVMPNVEAVVTGDLVLKLADIVGTPATLTAAAKNAYPVSIPIPANFILASTTTRGYPSPLTAPTNQNAAIFAPDIIDLHASVSNDYKEASKDDINVIGKGKSLQTTTENLLDGNELLSNKTITTIEGTTYLNDPILKYTKIVIDHNVFKPGIRGNPLGNTFLDANVDASAPPASFEPEINDIDKKGFYTDAKKRPVTLIDLQQKANTTVTQNKYYSTSNGKGLDYQSLASLVDYATGKPSKFNSSDPTFYVDRNEIKPDSTSVSLTNSDFGKGKEASKDYDGHNLLSTVGGNLNTVDNRFAPGSVESFGTLVENTITSKNHPLPADHPLGVYTNIVDTLTGNAPASAILKAGNNRWSSRGEAGGDVPRSFNKKLKIPRKDKPGGFIEVSHLKMAKVGTGLLQRAAGELPAFLDVKFNPTGGLAEVAAMVPSVVQLGIKKIDNVQLTANDVLDHLTDDDESVDSLLNIARGWTDGNQSWGAANSSTEPYDEGGLSSAGTTLAMIAMVIAIAGLYTAIGEAGNSNVDRASSRSKPTDSDTFGQYVKGKYLFEPQGSLGFSFMPSLEEVFGIRKTKNAYNKTLAAGAKAFFIGSGAPATSFGDLILTLLGAGVDSAFGENSIVNANVIVCRTIIRSALVFAIAIDSIIRKFQQNPLAGIKAILSMLTVWRSSKLIASMNVFSAIGDALLDRQATMKTVIGPDGKALQIPDSDDAPNPTIETKFAVASGADDIDSLNIVKNSNQSTVRKSKLSPVSGENFNRTLAWSSQRAPSMYLLPTKVTSLQNVMGGPTTLHNNTNSMLKLFENDTARILDTDRETFERMLDAEYVPFSFQDIRTNEIISFHAFLSTLSDDYSASYESVEGFGRVEPIKIYKSTTRKIGMSFHVASTSPEDFDQMWYKINKLLTFVYPQYTPGRDLISSSGTSTYQFKAPFSQQPGASPLIRIRLGDLIRSNYSRFALARLFGAADGNMSIPKGTGTKSDDISATPIDFDPNSAWAIDYNDKATELSTAAATAAADAYGNADNPLTVTELAALAQTLDDKTKALAALKSSKKRVPPDQTAAAEKSVTAAQNALDEGNIKNATIAKLKSASDAATAAAKSAQTFAAKFGTDSALAAGRKGAIDAFMDPKNNAIVKSFETAAGKGLAGVIESMSFDWYNQTTWDTDPGKTAPKMCKVTISFSPIHDITPGIDHNGYNRAPVYPVGAYSKNQR